MEERVRESLPRTNSRSQYPSQHTPSPYSSPSSHSHSHSRPHPYQNRERAGSGVGSGLTLKRREREHERERERERERDDRSTTEDRETIRGHQGSATPSAHGQPLLATPLSIPSGISTDADALPIPAPFPTRPSPPSQLQSPIREYSSPHRHIPAHDQLPRRSLSSRSLVPEKQSPSSPIQITSLGPPEHHMSLPRATTVSTPGAAAVPAPTSEPGPDLATEMDVDHKQQPAFVMGPGRRSSFGTGAT